MTTFGQPRRHVAQCGSTNDLAREWAKDPNAPAPSGALVTAEYQTQGRGRRGRAWQAGFGQSALMSFVYRPLSPSPEWGQLGLVTALAVAEALHAVSGLQSQIKWPNDLLINGKKAAGILVEAFEGTAILGVGINVNQERFVGAEGFAYPPTSLRMERGEPLEVARVVEAVAQALTDWEERWREGFPPILENGRERLALGAVVRRGEDQGELAGLTSQGGARVRLPDGTFTEWMTVD